MKRISLNTELTPVINRGGLQQSYWTIKKMKLKTVENSELLTHKKQIDNDIKFKSYGDYLIIENHQR
jgi:hypothetical protein